MRQDFYLFVDSPKLVLFCYASLLEYRGDQRPNIFVALHLFLYIMFEISIAPKDSDRLALVLLEFEKRNFNSLNSLFPIRRSEHL